MLAVGSSVSTSTSSSFSSCLLFERARVAVLARALFLSMNSCNCFRLASTAVLVRSSCSRRSCLIFQKGFDRAGKHRQPAAGQVERVGAGGRQEGPIVRDDQAGLLEIAEKMLEQNLRAQIEKVGRLVEQQQIGIVQQQCRQFHPGLPAAGKFADRPVEISPFELELAGHFAAPPVGLAAVAHQEIQGRLARLKRIVLAQISQPQLGMPDTSPTSSSSSPISTRSR